VAKRQRYEPPEGWVVQAFCFALDLTADQSRIVARHFGARRKAYNWALGRIRADLEAYRRDGVVSAPPSLYGLRKAWNQAKEAECVSADTGEVWWPEVSKEAFADGVRGAVDGYWRWQKSRAGEIKGRRVGFPRFKKKGRDQDRYTITTGTMRLEADRRHLSLPRLGPVRTWENTKKLQRLIVKGRARILAVTLRRQGTRIVASLRVALLRPQQASNHSASKVGVDVGVRVLATVADADGGIVERAPNPAPLNRELANLRRLNRQRSRRTKGSRRYRETNAKISRLHCRIRNIRADHIHKLTSRLANTQGRIVVEGLDASAMMKQKGLVGARARRRGLADAALAEPRRQLRYKCTWYGAILIEADRFFASSKTCHRCRHSQDIGWAKVWTCDGCAAVHDRDDNAAINLARWSPPSSDLGGVAASVKRGAEHKTRPRRAVGVDTRKQRPDTSDRSNLERGA
jgi:putative transposase